MPLPLPGSSPGGAEGVKEGLRPRRRGAPARVRP